jgi:hypothetical protein
VLFPANIRHCVFLDVDDDVKDTVRACDRRELLPRHGLDNLAHVCLELSDDTDVDCAALALLRAVLLL